MKKLVLAALLAVGTALPMTTTTASADSCWWHNGSLVRLVASGSYREFRYERPRPGLWSGGVRRGTLLFNGNKYGNRYVGTARVFSKYCPGSPLQYSVSGPVSPGQTRVTVIGTRRLYRRCRPTNQFRRDVLVFTYSHRC